MKPVCMTAAFSSRYCTITYRSKHTSWCSRSQNTQQTKKKQKQEGKQYGKMKTHKLPDKMIQRFSAQRALFTCTNTAEKAACSSLETDVSVSTNQWLRYVLPKVWFRQKQPCNNIMRTPTLLTSRLYQVRAGTTDN